jgi:hypothetical protein
MKKLIVCLLLAPAVISCVEIPSEDKKETRQEEFAQAESPEVELNEGEPWPANAETITGIDNLKQLAERFDSSSDSYEELQSQMREEFSLIFKNCTMKGEAHEQLHNYLLPLMDFFGELTTSNQDAALTAIRKHLAQFDEYFVAKDQISKR